ncbi:MAG: hypothetical protein B7Z61_13440 [Acidobacteria bacterium 37-71-11]|nr:MAG: hypothetical protein B7Z61_13440 [Acidobacteria bacterium 37-71-11]
MAGMVKGRLALAVTLLAAAAATAAEPARELTHRVWLLSGVPDAGMLTALRAAGVDGLVVPVGRVEVGDGSSRFTLAPLPDLRALAGWPVTALVWVDGADKASGDPQAFAAQFAPAQRGLPGSPRLLFASRRFFPGLAGFATGVASRLKQTVELAAPVQELAAHLPPRGWTHIRPVAVALGNPSALGFPAATLQDDLAALDRLDATGTPYRVAVVVAPLADPAPGPAGASLALLASGETAVYAPGERGDTFRLRQPVDWGGVEVAAGRSITVEAVDTARYHRDLGLLLRPARPALEGWDTVGLPAPEPALGMSREAFLEYLQGGSPYPVPRVDVEWVGSATMRVALANPTAQASALSTTGNWVELRFAGTEVRDAQLGEFSGMEYGSIDAGGTWRRTAARGASALRFYLTFIPPQARVAGALVTFISRPRAVETRWGMRVGDGGAVTGSLEGVALRKR